MIIVKKIVSVLLVLCLSLYTSATALAVGFEIDETDMSAVTALAETDALLVASSILNSSDTTHDILSAENTTANDAIQLYNESGNVVALYISFEPTGYAIINNNSSNPTVIEFGEGKNQLIEDILSAENNPRIIYNHPTEIYSINTQMSASQTISNDKKDLYSYFPDLREDNENAVMQLNQLKTILNNSVSVCGDGDYGFISLSNMPSGSFVSDTIDRASTTTWADMDDYRSFATDHCGATAVTNIALYYAEVGYTYLKIQDVDFTFTMVHNIVGNGPKTSITADAQEYFESCGYTLVVDELGVASFSNIVSAVGRNHPCGVLLADGINNWHWVVCVGYRQYTSGTNYMQIVTGWSNSSSYFYSPNSGSTVFYVGEFSIV